MKAAEPQPIPQSIEPGPARAAGGLDEHYEQLRHAALTARADALRLGFAVLSRRGVLAWRAAVARIAVAGPTPRRSASAAHALSLPTALTAELVDALAGLALTGT
ncbi:hypothetical protein [Nocardia amamiensis]|uniref:hypothetical protein n=1 Tax=Nocardia amamiensis TaxID=404578 RepID=UPI00082DCCAF|nr:hypothetical protein [Nocardia amamiensis]